jgi:hypothetical protein
MRRGSRVMHADLWIAAKTRWAAFRVSQQKQMLQIA